MVTLLVLALLATTRNEYQLATVYVALSFVILGVALFVYERGFTPGVVWVTKDGKRVGDLDDGEWKLDSEYAHLLMEGEDLDEPEDEDAG